MNPQDRSAAESRLRQHARQCIGNQQWDAAQTTLESLALHAPNDAAVLVELTDVILKRSTPAGWTHGIGMQGSWNHCD